MKIERIEIYPLEAKLPKPFGWSQRWTDARMTTAVKITADDGTYGWGESGNAQGMEAVAPLLIGKDPRRTEAIWQMLYTLRYQGHGSAGPHMLAISAFDMALWDIAERRLGCRSVNCWAGVCETTSPYTPPDSITRRTTFQIP